MATTTLAGAYTALVTPFVPGGSAVDHDRLRRHVHAQGIAGVQGVVPCGTTGETPTLSGNEHRAVVRTVLEAARPAGLQVIAGAGANDTAHAVELHRFAHEAGADAALHVTPYYNRPSQAGLRRHFETLADSCDLPIVVYVIPGRTGTKVDVATLAALAAHPNVIAVKDATGTFDLALRVAAETDLAILSGDDPLTLPLASIGGRGVISVASNVRPALVAALCRACLEGDLAAARRIHEALLPLARALLVLDVNPVPVKTALALLGRDTGAMRLPLVPMAAEAENILREVLDRTPERPADAGGATPAAPVATVTASPAHG